MTELAIPTALEVLRGQLRTHGSAADIALPLRALQMRGLSKLALVVQLERLRISNSLTTRDDAFEESCLLALDLINSNLPGLGLVWDAAHEAASLLPRCLTADDLYRARQFALEPSDLLPPRARLPNLDSPLVSSISATAFETISTFHRLPVRADFFRAPKDAFTTRPAAVLALEDHLVLEGLVEFVETELMKALPDSVIWPRHRLQLPAVLNMAKVVEGWNMPYVAKADISAFYENIEHALLAVFLVGQLNIAVHRARAVESMLGAVMGSSRGLPQGPAASDVLASAYLLGIDRELERQGFKFVRYADDYFFPVQSVAEGRRVLQSLESLLTEIGLSLNNSKTKVMRRETYERGLKHPSPTVEALKERITNRRVESVSEMEDVDDIVDVLEEAGVDEDLLFAVFYHETATLEEAVHQARDRLGPSLDETYHIYFHSIATMLRSGVLEGDANTIASLARECLLVLMSSDSRVRPTDLNEVLTWFPTLVPLISDYLIQRPDGVSAATTTMVRRRLKDLSRIDWFDAWMCRTAGAPYLLRSRRVIADLRTILMSEDTLPLTRVEAARSLARGGTLHLEEWKMAFQRVSLPLRSEMFFTALSNLNEYPWMAESLIGIADPAQDLVARSLLQPPPELGRGSKP